MRVTKKHKIFISISLVTILAVIMYLWYYNQITQNVNYVSSAKNKAWIIESALRIYINESGDIELKNYKVVSGKTKTEELCGKLKEPVNTSNRILGPYLQKDFNYSIYASGYKGFRIDIIKSSENVKVSLSKKASDSKVIIN